MTTQVHNLSHNWQQVATGPCLVEVSMHQGALVHFGDVAPAADSAAYHRLGVELGYSLPYGGSTNCYARTESTDVAARLIVTPA